MKADNILMLAIAAMLGAIFWTAFGPETSSRGHGPSAAVAGGHGELAAAMASGQPVLIDFYADWCGPCRKVAPTVHELANELAGRAKVVKVDVDQHQALAQQYGIRSIPTFVVVKGGQEVARESGALPKAVLREMLGL